MPAMSCRLNGLFSISEDFDDEDLLGSNWAVGTPTTVPSHPVASRESGTNLLQRSAFPHPALTSETVAPTLRKLSSGTQSCPRSPELSEPHFGAQPKPGITSQTCLPSDTHVTPRDPGTNLPQSNGESSNLASNKAFRNPISCAHPLRPAAAVPFRPLGQETVAPTLRKLSSGTRDSPELDPGRVNTPKSPISTTVTTLRPLGAVSRVSNTKLLQQSGEAESHLGAQQKPTTSAGLLDDFDDWDLDLADLEECERLAAPLAPVRTLHPPTGGGSFRPPTSKAPHLISTSSSTTNSLSRTLGKIQHAACSTPAPLRPPRGLFETVSPTSAPPTSPSLALSPHPLSTPLLTNHLVQLVSASNKASRKRPRSEPLPPRTRRFPGPAGLLPQQYHNHSLDEIVVSVPQTPCHGVPARLTNQVSSSQVEEEELGGPWAAMKADMGLDERNPACFLRSFSVVMVLRKAALKQLNKNKVPNMAVMLKSISHTHTDAKAVFRDPTGEIQGTVHRRLLEERMGELKIGAVLLLKQVGVFSPSHRNHYLNVTPNNLLRIYSPDGVCHTSGQLPPLVLEPTPPSPTVKPVSCMQLVFDDEDDSNEDRTKCKDGSLQTTAWDADDLDELLVALPEDTYNL